MTNTTDPSATPSNSIATAYSSLQSQPSGTQAPQSQATAAKTPSPSGAASTPSAKSGQSTGQVSAVVASFSERSQADQAVNQLRQQGFKTEEINIVAKKSNRKSDETETTYYNDDVTDGALTGGTLGGIGGLLVGAGALAIPGIGPIVAAGPIAAALSGAVAGGVAGGMIDYGIPSAESKRLEEKVANGEIVAMVRADQSKVNQATTIFTQNGANEVKAHVIA